MREMEPRTNNSFLRCKGVLYNSGNLGIASSTPWAKLSVTNTGTGPSFIVEDSTSPDTTPFIIDASGNVGIGTASSGRKLEISHSSSEAGLLLGKTDTGYGTHTGLEFSAYEVPKAGIYAQRDASPDGNFGRGNLLFATDGAADNNAVSLDGHEDGNNKSRQRRCSKHDAMAHALGDRHRRLRRPHGLDRRRLALPR